MESGWLFGDARHAHTEGEQESVNEQLHEILGFHVGLVRTGIHHTPRAVHLELTLAVKVYRVVEVGRRLKLLGVIDGLIPDAVQGIANAKGASTLEGRSRC